MSSEAPAPTPAPDETRLPLVELDRALAPIRRLAAWGSSDSEHRATEVRYLESTVERWVSAAKALDLPESLTPLLDAQREAVAGFDAAEASVRAEQLASLYQAVCRLDALLGLPLHDVPIRPPRKPRLPDWRVEESPEPEPEPELEPRSRRDDDRPLVSRGSRRRSKKSEAPEPLPPFWSGRISASVDELQIPEAWADGLVEAGVSTAENLLLLRPTGTTRYEPIHGAGRQLPEGEDRLALGGRVKRRWSVLRPDGTREHRVQLKGAGRVDLVWTGDAIALQAAGGMSAYEPESRAIVVGAPTPAEGQVELHDAERAVEDGDGGVQLRSYGVDSVDDVVLRGVIGRMLPLAGQVRDLLPGSELSRNDQEPLRNLLDELHHKDAERARRRLAFDEAMLVQIGLSLERYRQNRDRGLQLIPLHSLISRLDISHGLSLDDAQQAVFEDIKRDLRRKAPMLRVVTGPPGSGRGLIGLLATTAVAEGKIQVMVLCPDPLAAEQRYLYAATPLREGGLVARLVEGKPTKAVRDAIGRGEIHVVYGTRDLLDADLDFRRLGLVVAEERTELGRVSARLRTVRAPRPHCLILPTVPIGPETALTAYADHDVSVLRSGPGRPKVSLVPAEDRSVVYGRAAEAMSSGGQVLVLFPIVKGADALDLGEAWRVVRALESDAFGKARIGLFHGSMPREERLRAYTDFRNRRLDVLVATTTIEEHPAPDGAVCVVVEQAERFETWRLERLRGILAPRTGAPAIWCVYSGTAEEAQTRLEVLLDDRSWSERVATARPPVFDTEVALPQLSWLDLESDVEILWRAREAGHRLLVSDPRLRAGWAGDIARTLRARWSEFYGPDAPELPLDDRRSTTQRSGSRRRRRRRKRN